MAAVYPKQYKSFTVHKNLVEDIDASHVNNLQDEVRAVQQTLGLNPHQDTGLTMKVNTWASVADRLDSVQRGDGMPVVYLSKTSDSYKAAAGVPMKRDCSTDTASPPTAPAGGWSSPVACGPTPPAPTPPDRTACCPSTSAARTS
jgi:hypothetical protein